MNLLVRPRPLSVRRLRLFQPLRLLMLVALAGVWCAFAAPTAARSQAPTITTLIPTSTQATLQAFTMRVVGTNLSLTTQVVYSAGANTFVLPPVALRKAAASQPDTLLVVVSREVNFFASVGNVIVRNDGSPATNVMFRVTAAPAPVITALSPSQAQIGGPTYVQTIIGQNFHPGIKVYFSNARLTVISVTSTEIKVIVPDFLIRTPGLLVLKVENEDGQEVGARYPSTLPVSMPAVIASIVPSSTTATGKAFTMTITGQHLGNVNIASLGSSYLRVLSVASTFASVEVPASVAAMAGQYLLTLTNNDGASSSVPYILHRIIPPPYILDIAPRSNAPETAGAFTLVIEGQNIMRGSLVEFVQAVQGSAVAGRVFRFSATEFVSSSEVSVRIPASEPPAGEYLLRLVNPDGQFNEQPQPYILRGPRITSVMRDEPPQAFSISPNPCTDAISVSAAFETPATVAVRILNVLGHTVLPPHSERVGRGLYTKQFDVSRLPAGVYLLELANGAARNVVRFVKHE